jgi:hypothetical protein
MGASAGGFPLPSMISLIFLPSLRPTRDEALKIRRWAEIRMLLILIVAWTLDVATIAADVCRWMPLLALMRPQGSFACTERNLQPLLQLDSCCWNRSE